MKLSVVATLYRSAPYIAEFHRRASAAAREFAGDSYEIIFVNDGSPDDSLRLAVGLSEMDPRVAVVDLSRNFGHHKAMMTGLAHARGDHVFLIDSDLEEEPEWLSTFAEQMKRLRSDVVYGVQERRAGGLFKRWSGQVFYGLFRALTGLALPDNIIVVRLMTRRYVNALLLHDEREVFMAGLWLITGFDQSPKSVVKRVRKETTYTLRRRVAQFVDSVTSFSSQPLVAIFVLGCFISLIAFVFIIYLIANWLMYSQVPAGWTSVMASVWLLGGFITASIGVIGIYLSKVFSETKRRPYTIVREVFGRSGKDVGE
jgi:putative glycosyltransferase